MISRLMFTTRHTAEHICGWPDWAVISITEPLFPGMANLMEGWHSILRVKFHDVDPTRGCDEPHVLMNRQHAIEIVEFVRSVAPEVQGILVHCHAGMSRSAAVAMWIAEAYDLPFKMNYGRHNAYVLQMLREADAAIDEGPVNV